MNETVGRLRPFHFWCQKVLPLVYDDSLSYYEVLCKMKDYLNQVIAEVDANGVEIGQIQDAIKEIEQWQDNWNEPAIMQTVQQMITEWLQNNFAEMIYVQIDSSGYFKFFIPSSWSDITFKTTGLDINLPQEPEYGHLVLQY